MPKPQPFNRRTSNLIANFQGLPETYSRAFMRKEMGLDAVLDQVIERFRLGETRTEETVAAHWTSIVGDRNAKHAHPLKLDRGNRLYIAVNNPVVKQEMQFHKMLILNRLKQIPGCQEIRSLVFRSG